MKKQIVKMFFRGPVHFGKGRLSDAEYDCDAATLFSAFFIEALSQGKAEELLKAAKEGNFAISDAFPFMGEELYVPKPMLAAASIGLNSGKSQLPVGDSRVRKAAKKLKYIPLSKLADFCNGEFDFVEELGVFHIGKMGVRTKVNVPRESHENAEPYHVGGFMFSEGCGLYFVFVGDFDIAPLLDALSVSGLGGKRTSGYGSFEYEIVDAAYLPICNNDYSPRKMLLTSAMMRDDELKDELLAEARYSLVKKAGFVQSVTHANTPRKKRSMWLFAPGSVFEQGFEGDIFDVNDTPGSHSVYRYARALWMEV